MPLGSARPHISFDDEFFASVAALEPSDNRRVMVAVDQFRKDPNHPSLRLKPLQGLDPASRLHSIRAAQHLRILLAREGNVYVFYEAGDRKDIYERAARKRFVVNPERGFAGLIHAPAPDLATLPQPPKRRAPELSDGPKAFDHWGDRDLEEAGFGPEEVAALRLCQTEDDLCTLDWDEESWNLAVDLLEQTPEQWRTPSLNPEEEAEQRVRESIAKHGALTGLSPLFTPEEVAEIAAAPIEDWMIFLHPDQRAIVERSFDGPARIRGAAGTGKTVVALHRAAALARRLRGEDRSDGKILFTTFIKTLPPVFEQLYLRMPGTRRGEVEFIHIDRLAGHVCRDAGRRPLTVPRSIDAAFAAACRQVLTPDSPLVKANLSRGYLRDEITQVIKGRGISSLDDYLSIERTGRRTPFTDPLRRQTWQLMEQWDAEMAERETVDFADVILLARDHARQESSPRYRAAIIDEAQDLTLVGLQLIRALVTDKTEPRPDELLVVGDGAQRIYAGGFTLRQAGVEVRGRTSVLRVNYRNTTEILDAAMAVAGDQDVEDLDERYKRGDEEANGQRRGGRPALVVCDGTEDQMAFIAEQARVLVESGALGFGDIGVFVPTNRLVGDYTSGLAVLAVPTTGLESYDGTSTPQVKVGTYFRAKGLEFKVVFLPEVTAGKFPRPQSEGQDDAEYAETRALAISQLFVAMTRARDGLFLLCDGTPSEVIAAAPADRFETIGE